MAATSESGADGAHQQVRRQRQSEAAADSQNQRAPPDPLFLVFQTFSFPPLSPASDGAVTGGSVLSAWQCGVTLNRHVWIRSSL